jgi:hypothetical protein
MDTDIKFRWIRLQPTSCGWRGLLLALLLVMASAGNSAAQGTPEERRACIPDVFRLCSAFIPNSDEITACLRAKNEELSQACSQIISTEMNPSNKNGTLQAQGRTTP